MEGIIQLPNQVNTSPSSEAARTLTKPSIFTVPRKSTNLAALEFQNQANNRRRPMPVKNE